MGFGERFSFALEPDDGRAHLCDRLGWNDRLELSFETKMVGQCFRLISATTVPFVY